MELRPIVYLCALGLLASCGQGGQGQLIGSQNRPAWYQVDPYGMNYIPMGSYVMGPSDQDAPYAGVAKSRTVSVQAFYMDQTEISNNEYRQFVEYVVDSIQKRLLGDADIGEHVITEDEFGEEIDPPVINWQEKVDYDDEEVREALADMYYQSSEQFYRRKEIDTRKLLFEYYWIDLQEAARKAGRDQDLNAGGYTNSKGQNFSIMGHSDRSKFIIKEVINVYPDTLSWVHDFNYSYNEPMTKRYFSHPAFGNYPVVGVSWKQATAFCEWRTHLLNSYLDSKKRTQESDFRLPTEAQWEYAARGGRSQSMFPWGNYYLRNKKGCLMANFKPGRGNYPEDGGFYTVRADAYWPNDYGLYCMSGNVAEWTSSIYYEGRNNFQHDMNPDVRWNAKDDDPPLMKRKIIRGGSWKDVGYYLQTGTSTYEYQDTTKSYIGFRCVIDLPAAPAKGRKK